MNEIKVIVSNTPYTLNHPYSYISEQHLPVGSLVGIEFAHRKSMGYVVGCQPLSIPNPKLKSIDCVYLRDSLFTYEHYLFLKQLASSHYISLSLWLSYIASSNYRCIDPYNSIQQSYVAIGQAKDGKLTKKQHEIIEDVAKQGLVLLSTLKEQYSSNIIKRLIDNQFLYIEKHYPKVEMPTWVGSMPTDIQDSELFKNTILPLPALVFILKYLPSLIYVSVLNKENVYIMVNDPLIADYIETSLTSVCTNIINLFNAANKKEELTQSYLLHHQTYSIIIGNKMGCIQKGKIDHIVVINSDDSSYDFDGKTSIPLMDLLSAYQSYYHTSITCVSLCAPLTQYQQLRYIDLSKDKSKCHLIDMKEHYQLNKGYFSNQALTAIHQAIEDKQNIVICLNRKGSYNQVVCTHCGKSLTCPECEVLLSYSELSKEFTCPSCNKTYTYNQCPTCGNHKFMFYNYGTQRIEKYCKQLFPNCNVIRLDKDNASLIHRIPFELNHDNSNIIIATQHYLTRLSIPYCGVIVVMDADSGFKRKNPFSSEKTMQYLFNCMHHQQINPILGTFIQVEDSTNPYLQYIINDDYVGFMNYEKTYRQANHLPPYGAIIVLQYDINAIETQLLTSFIEILKRSIVVYGPSLINKKQAQLLLMGNDLNQLQEELNQCLSNVSSKVKNALSISVNSYNII